MIGHSILFNVLPLAVHGLPVRALTFRPIPPRGPTRKVSLSSRQEEAEHREPDAAADRHMVPGVRGNELMDGAASAERLAANDLPSGAQSRAEQGDLAA